MEYVTKLLRSEPTARSHRAPESMVPVNCPEADGDRRWSCVMSEVRWFSFSLYGGNWVWHEEIHCLSSDCVWQRQPKVQSVCQMEPWILGRISSGNLSICKKSASVLPAWQGFHPLDSWSEAIWFHACTKEEGWCSDVEMFQILESGLFVDGLI